MRVQYCYYGKGHMPDPTTLPGRLDMELEQTEPKAPRSHTTSGIILHLWHPQSVTLDLLL